MEVIRIVNSVFRSNTFLIEDESGMCFLVDCGDIGSIVRYLQCKEFTLGAVFITHAHYDHIYGLNELFEVYPQLIVYTSLHGKEGLYSDKLNLSKYHSNTFVFQYDSVETLQEKQLIEISKNKHLEVYETPGHDWSSLCYKIGNNVFTGDSCLPQYGVVANLPKSDKNEALKSIERIKNISIGCNIFPGHGDIVQI
ncbi:MBL fold metallo-hydrolase [Bacteroides fragilis]|jgi:hypothetical protein|nr:MBL fold metallo-hydrolase [Bacteroides fragilis]